MQSPLTTMRIRGMRRQSDDARMLEVRQVERRSLTPPAARAISSMRHANNIRVYLRTTCQSAHKACHFGVTATIR